MKMMFMKLLFLLLAVPAIEGWLSIWKPKGSSLEERVTKKILETCYGYDDFNELIFILGDFNEVLDETFVIRMKNLLNVDEDYESRQFSSFGVTKILIIEDSSEKLYSDLTSFKKTRWWNHMLPFFIIGKNDEKCENFEEILNTAWEMDILNAIYICSESENTTLYTLNSITNYAPKPWARMEDLNDLNIYHQIFNSHTSCNNLNYDKTEVLNGYQIKIGRTLYTKDWSRQDDIDAYPDSRLFHLVMIQLNASLIYQCTTISFKNWFSKGDNVNTIWEHSSWMATERIPLSILIKAPNREVVLVKADERTVLYKIGHLWSIQVLFGAAIALIILFSILAMKTGEVTLAILDIIRFLTYLSIRTDMRSNAFRIYFTTMLIFIVISNGVFQGKIAAFLTTLDKVPPMKTIEELWDSGYHFYIPFLWASELLPETRLSQGSRVTVVDDDVCIDYVLNGTLNVCIMPLSLYEEEYLSKPLDCLRLPFRIGTSHKWKSRRNWPLYERFNYMHMRAIESGIYTKWQDEDLYRARDRRNADDQELALAEIVSPYQPIELVKLDFAFKLLGIGLSFAALVLIVELRMEEIQ